MVHRCCSHTGNNNQAVVVVLIPYASLASSSIAMASEAEDAVAFESAFGDEGGRLKRSTSLPLGGLVTLFQSPCVRTLDSHSDTNTERWFLPRLIK